MKYIGSTLAIVFRFPNSSMAASVNPSLPVSGSTAII